MLELLNPLRYLFEAVGLVSSRTRIGWTEWLKAKRVYVLISGEGNVSYSPDEHPAYRDAFHNQEYVAENLRHRTSIRRGDFEAEAGFGLFDGGATGAALIAAHEARQRGCLQPDRNSASATSSQATP